MSRRRHALFPDGLSDETAVALCDFLYQLAIACESHYLQISGSRRGMEVESRNSR